MQIIKDKKIVDDSWQRITEIAGDASLPAGDVIIPFAYWLENRAALSNRDGMLGVCINGDDDIHDEEREPHERCSRPEEHQRHDGPAKRPRQDEARGEDAADTPLDERRDVDDASDLGVHRVVMVAGSVR